MIKKFLILLLIITLIIFTVENVQGVAVKSNQRLKKEHDGELSDDTGKRLIKLLEAKFSEEIKLDELKKQVRETELKLSILKKRA